MTTNREVILICGPPAAGKTHTAHALAKLHTLEVFDRDDSQWSNEAEFLAALRRLGQDPAARAVVIRTGATTSARIAAARLIRSTSAFILTAEPELLKRRVRERRREDLRQTIAGIDQWFRAFDHSDQLPIFSSPPDMTEILRNLS